MRIGRFTVLGVVLLLFLWTAALWAAQATDADVAYLKAKVEAGQTFTDEDVRLAKLVNATTTSHIDIDTDIEQMKDPFSGIADTPQRSRVTLDEYVWSTTTYNWADISTLGAALTSGDDSNQGPFPLGFSFPFYENTYTDVRVCTNGFLLFGTATTTTWTNTAIPNTSVPNNAVYPFWDDMDTGDATTAFGQIRYYADTAHQRFIVSWLGVPHHYTTDNPTHPYTFQCILYPNGNIVFQYQTVQLDTIPGDTSCTVGIENSAGTQAVQVCFNGTGTRPAPGTAILIGQPNGVPNPVTNLAGSYVAPNVVLTWTDPSTDTYGNPVTLTNVEVWLGAAGTGQLLGTVNRGVQTYTHLNAPAGSIIYSVRPYANPYYGTAVSTSVIGAPPVYPNDFESDNGGWVADPPTGGWEWGAPTYASGPTAHGGTKVWGTVLASTYAINACYKLTLARNLAVTSPNASIEFWRWWDTEQSFDGVNFKVSVDQGATWTLVQPVGNYPYTSSTSTACIPSEPYWAGHSGGTWTLITIPLGQFLGQTPWFRFTFGSDVSINYSGFYFDDMTINGIGETGAVPRPPTNFTGNYSGGNVTLTWTDPTQDIHSQPMIPDSLQIWLGPIGTGTRLGVVNPGIQTYTHQNAPIGIQSYSVRAYNDGFPGASATVSVIVGTPSYVNDFELDNGSWVADPSTNGWAWGTPSTTGSPMGGHSGTHVWGTRLDTLYRNNACYLLTLSPGLVVQSSNATVEFWYWYDTEATWDGCTFQVSADGGSNWDVGRPLTGYPDSIEVSTNCPCNSGLPVWGGNGRQWAYAVIPIGQYMGQTPMFRFRFGSDDISLVYSGFFFDDMIIWGMRAASSITGVVRTTTSQAIPNARVWAVGQSDTVTTDATGTYLLPVEPGTYSVTFDHIHYCDTTYANVVVNAGSQTVRNATMRAPHGQVNVTSLSIETAPSVAVQDTFVISNPSGQCPLDFVVTDTSTWITVTPDNGTVNPNQTRNVIVLINPTGMSVGDYSSTLRIVHNSTGSPSTVRIDLHIASAANDPNLIPTEFAYYQNYPNPFNAQTALRFDVPLLSRVNIIVYNIMGQEVARPVDNIYAPGRYRVLYNASDLPSGMYLVKMSAGSYEKIGKMMLLK